jgi:isopentenyl-diphosphate delta-isomerase
MTGGHAEGRDVNAGLATAAARAGIGMGVGSQRAALRDAALRETYEIARRQAPEILLIANVGAAQLVPQSGASPLAASEVGELVAMIGADALAVHLNLLQELVQPEGDRNARGWLAAIERLVATVPVPVVAKETGGGVSEAVARRLAAAGVAAIDVGGRGGTSFAAIEGTRAAEQGDERGAALGETFRDWGIPTAASIALAARAGRPVIATGGLRSGLDLARAIALGATAGSMARPMLQALRSGGPAGLGEAIGRIAEELRVAMLLTGSADLDGLRRAPRLIGGETARWLAAPVP